VIDDDIRKKMREAMNPEKFGGVFSGNQTFTIDTLLPEIPLGGARLMYDQISVFGDGMTLGGQIKLPSDLDGKTFRTSVKSFGQPHRLEFCSMAVHPAVSSKNKGAHPGEITFRGGVYLENSGAFHDL